MESVEQIKNWAQMWKEIKQKGVQNTNEIQEAWKKIQIQVMQEKELKWRKVTGPMTATMKALLDNGWKIVKPDQWIRVIGNDEKELGKITEKPQETQAVVRAFGQDVETEIWKKAARHYLGRGLENGPPSMEAARRAKKHLLRKVDTAKQPVWTS